MMTLKPFYNNYAIHSADVWQYEACLFLEGKSTKEHAKKLLDEIHLVILEHAKPAFGWDQYIAGNSDFKNYYDAEIEKYKQANGKLEELYGLGFFFFNSNCYEYNSNVIIELSHKDFDYWFGLKLRQYESKLSTIDEFLNYHLEKIFDDDKEKYSRFLVLLIRQYQSQFIGKEVTKTVKEWIKNTKAGKEIFSANPSIIKPTDENAKIEDDIIFLDEVLKLTGYKKATLYTKVSRYEIPVLSRRKPLTFSKSEIIQWIKDGKPNTIDQQADKFLNRRN